MKKYSYLVVLVIIIIQFNSANSQSFPDINNDTTKLVRVTEDLAEGFQGYAIEVHPDFPIYFDTTNLSGFYFYHLLDFNNKDRYYSNFPLQIEFNERVFHNKDSIIIYDSIKTDNKNISLLIDSIKFHFKKFKLIDYYYNDEKYSGKNFIMHFDSIINIDNLYEYIYEIILSENIIRNLTVNQPIIIDTGIKKDVNKNFGLYNSSLIFPNPSSEKISLDLGGVAVADLVVYDILGNEIMSIPNYTNKSEVDIRNLSIGTYTIQIQTNTGSISKRLLVNR